MNEKIERIKRLTARLNEASRVYYSEGNEIMPNVQYDALYDELVSLEKETGFILSDSPTQRVGYDTVSSLPKEQHQIPMLSLDKTKSVDALAAFAGGQRCILSWKLDGLTVVLTYENGSLVKAMTRGNGEIGEVVTNNAKTFENIPLTIPFQGRLVLRGEAVISYADFEKINESTESEVKYKNPRNLCSGAVRQLNSRVTASRHVNWLGYSVIEAENEDFGNSIENQFTWLKGQGFETVEYRIADEGSMEAAVQYFSEKIDTYKYPSDGLVIIYDDIAYGRSLGRTAKFPRNSIAFKWADEMEETRLTDIEWSTSRTGLINPIALFEPVELEGTTVSRASVHNISVMRELKLGKGDRIKVYKANMIIPQIAENLDKSDNIQIPENCPVCGGKTRLETNGDVSVLYCTNPECSMKQIKAFSLFVSRNALNIDGLSDMTLEKFLKKHIIETLPDLFHLKEHKEEIVSMGGMGEKSYRNLIKNIEAARDTELSRLIYGLGITGVGLANARMLCRYFKNRFSDLMNASPEELAQISGIGDIMAAGIHAYFSNEKNQELIAALTKELTFEQDEDYDVSNLLGEKIFVVTGSLNSFSNRDELKAKIESLGGKVTSSVTKKTDYLINNDIMSSSGKNRKAKELSIPIITEEDFLDMIDQ